MSLWKSLLSSSDQGSFSGGTLSLECFPPQGFPRIYFRHQATTFLFAQAFNGRGLIFISYFYNLLLARGGPLHKLMVLQTILTLINFVPVFINLLIFKNLISLLKQSSGEAACIFSRQRNNK